MKLSANFNLAEFLRSAKADELGIVLDPPEPIVDNLRSLCVDVLEPIRSLFPECRISISSGWRPVAVNVAVGGSKNSDHIDGLAADFNVEGVNTYDAAMTIAKAIHTLPVKQLIYEFGRWVHVSVAAPGDIPRRQIFTARKLDGRTNYITGIVRA